MKLFDLSSLFQLYYIIRTKYPWNNRFSWSIVIFYFLQILIVTVCGIKPSEIFDISMDSSFIHYLESVFLFAPWLFATKDFASDSLFYFVLLIIPFLVILYSNIHLKRSNTHQHVNYWCTCAIRLFQQYFIPTVSVTLYFRLAYLIEQIFILKETGDNYVYFSFALVCLNFVMLFIHLYMASVFLIPMDFVVNSKVDRYDGKTQLELDIFRMLLCMVGFFFSYAKDVVTFGILMAVVFVICLTSLYFRLIMQVYVSPIAQYFEVSPFFVCPFILIFKFYSDNQVYLFILVIGLLFIFSFIFTAINRFIVKQSLKVFSPLMSRNKQISHHITRHNHDELFQDSANLNNDDFSPSFIPGSITSIIRSVFSESGDPECLLRFLNLQKRSSNPQKTSSIIEVIRFIALFPSKRQNCLNRLMNLESQSPYNSFTIFIFKKILKGLNFVEVPEKNTACLTNLYRSFLVHQYLYWIARKKKQYFRAVKESICASYFQIEVDNEFQYLLRRFYFSPGLHYYYADFCLSGRGNFNTYQKEMEIGRLLEGYSSSNEVKSTSHINDPLLYPMSIVNPRILQFCSPEEKKKSFSTHKTDLDSHFLNETKNTSNKMPVAAYLNEKKYPIPLLGVFQIFVPLALFIYIIAALYPIDTQIRAKTVDIYENTVQLMKTFYCASSAIYLPYLTSMYRNNSKVIDGPFIMTKIRNLNRYKTIRDIPRPLDQQLDAYEAFLHLPFNMADFYTEIQPISNLAGGMLYTLERYLSKAMIENATIEEILNNLDSGLDKMVSQLFQQVYVYVEQSKQDIESLESAYKNNLDIVPMLKVTIISLLLLVVLSFLTFLVQINCIYRKDSKKIDYLSSNQRFIFFLRQESDKGWEYLSTFLEAQNSLFSTEHLSDTGKSYSNETIKRKTLGLVHPTSTKYSSLETSNDSEALSIDQTEKESQFGSNDKLYQEIELTDVDSDASLSNSFSHSDSYEEQINSTLVLNQATEESAFSVPVWVTCVLIFLTPLLLTILINCLFMMPFSRRSNLLCKDFQNLEKSISRGNHSLILLNISFEILQRKLHKRPENASIISFESLNGFLTDLIDLPQYTEETCYRLPDVICMSVAKSIKLIFDNSTTVTTIASQCLPIIYVFTWNVFQQSFYLNVNELRYMRLSHGISFIIAFIFLVFAVLDVVIAATKMLRKGFNSLFHFPDDFLDPPREISKETNKHLKNEFPQNVLVITTITKTDEIYSVSDNSKEILNRTLNELITLKMSETFPRVTSDSLDSRSSTSNMCEFMVSDNKKKLFRFSTEEIGFLTKAVLVEENPAVLDNPREKTYVQRLSTFIPTCFAEAYGKYDQTEFTYRNNFLLSVRISPDLPVQIVEKCFNTANHISQCFQSINIIHVDGEMITFSSISDCKLIVLLLLVRDFKEEIVKNTKNPNCIYSMFIDFMDDFTIDIVHDDELYLTFKPVDQNYFRFRLYQVENGDVAITKKLASRFKKIKKLCKKTLIPIDFEGNEEILYTVDLSTLISKIVTFIE